MSQERKTPEHSADALAIAVHWTLLLGLVFSALLMVAGLIVALVKNQPRPEELITNVRELLRLAIETNGVAWMELGVLALLFTPILRVVVLAIGWSIERDRRMALVAITVLVLLTISLIVGVG
jgi:uncharacterized membrane protein